MLAHNVRRYVLLALAELAEPWRGFCHRGACSNSLLVIRVIAPLPQVNGELQDDLLNIVL
jgi:hypothetical protein